MESKAIKVLLVEDNQPDSRLLRTLLAENPTLRFELTEVTRLAAALQCLATSEFDVVLIDLSLPDSHGIESFTRLHEAAPDTAVLVLSGLDDETLAVRAVREGAQDYLVKGKFDGHALSRAIAYAVERHRIELELQEKEQLPPALAAIDH
jgi:DNA-binding NarL/FixJ family response regulator